MQADTSRRNVIIAAVIIGMIILGVAAFLINRAVTQSQVIPESGGAGQPTPGSLILLNMDEPTDDGDAVPLGFFLSTDQQNAIISQLESVLRLTADRSSYKGSVKKQSVHANYNTNDVSFTVKVEDPAVEYNVIINTSSNAISITDQSGKKVN